MHGVIFPPVYEIFPYYFNSNIIEKVHNFVHEHGRYQHGGQGDVAHAGVKHIWVNESTGLPYGENKIAYFTEDIGLAAYYAYVQMASYMIPWVTTYLFRDCNTPETNLYLKSVIFTDLFLIILGTGLPLPEPR